MANKILRGLPSEAYTDKDFWNKECNTVFVNNWVFAGFAHELKNIGDVVPIKVADQPILLLKNTLTLMNLYILIFPIKIFL